MDTTDFGAALANLPPDTPITAAHVAAIVEALSKREPAKRIDVDELASGQLINEDVLAQWLDESRSTLQKWRVKGGGPAFVKNPKSVRYRVGAVREWIESRTVRSTSESTLRGLSAFQSAALTALFASPRDRIPVMQVEDRYVEFFASIEKCVEAEPQAYVVLEVSQLSALRKPIIPPTASAREAAELRQLLEAFFEFADKVKRRPVEAKAEFDRWKDHLAAPVRIAYFLQAAAYAPAVAHHIAESIEAAGINDLVSIPRWAWATALSPAAAQAERHFEAALSVVASYISDLSQEDQILDTRGRAIFRGNIAELLANNPSNGPTLDFTVWRIQSYEHVVRALLNAGLDVDRRSRRDSSSAREIADEINKRSGFNDSPFLKIVNSVENFNKLQALLASK